MRKKARSAMGGRQLPRKTAVLDALKSPRAKKPKKEEKRGELWEVRLGVTSSGSALVASPFPSEECFGLRELKRKSDRKDKKRKNELP